MSDDLDDPDEGTPPQTGVAAVDDALSALDLGDDVAGHPAEFAAAVDVLQAVLRGSGTR